MPSVRRAKIICTIGPSVDDERTLARLVDAGMDAARLNLSYGVPEEHVERIARLRRISTERGRHVAIIADIPGPKVRLASIAGSRCVLEAGATVAFRAGEGLGNDKELLVDSGFFHENMITGDRILLSDGLVELRITRVRGEFVETEVVAGGEVAQGTAVHLPAVFLRHGPITKDDEPLLRLAVQHGVDYIALTYVRDGADILGVRERLEALGRNVPLIAKIERHEAFARLDGILERADAVMIRRGDLGANIALTRVPAVQKQIVRLANQRGVPVITATKMLGSMVDAPRPTRAEASDVSNAIVDGVDGVLLSSETAIGKYPVESLQMMDRIIVETERAESEHPRLKTDLHETAGFADTTAAIACQAALQCNARLIACFTASGRSAGLVAKYRPTVPIIALCHEADTRRRLAIHWGVRTEELGPVDEAERMIKLVDERLIATHRAKKGDRIVIVYGAPVGEVGHTNSVRLHNVASYD